ncbi:MAG: alcohol acetyltransferase [Lachnospiraceae bacterium]|nr:alcohol acetyltransferase [Lachnospiraceae bacterium]
MARKDSGTTKKGILKSQAWYKLDLTAIVFPTLQRRDFSSVYRMSVLLHEQVDPELLQQAFDKALERFPTYKVAIRSGLFWRYFEQNNKPGPYVQKDVKNPCQPMSFRMGSRYLVRLYYYENRISFEAHHCLGDGTGGMAVFLTIVATYLHLKGYNDFGTGGYVKDITEESPQSEMEDAYMRYTKPGTKVTKPPRGPEAYRVLGTKEPFYTLNIIDGIMPAGEVKTVAKKYGATVTEYFNAVLLDSLLRKQKKEGKHRMKPVALAMPVNLRQFYPSDTLRNFITMVYPCVDPNLGEYTFEEIVKQVHNYMKYFINEKFLGRDVTANASIQRNPLIKIVPLGIKDLVVKTFYTKVQDRSSSAGLTNMGKLTLPKGMEKYIARVDINMGQPFSCRTNCAIISYNDILTVNFASSIKEADVERWFFRRLVKDGIHVKIESNRE